MQCTSLSGLMSNLSDFLQHLLRLQLLQSQQRQTQLVLLEREKKRKMRIMVKSGKQQGEYGVHRRPGQLFLVSKWHFGQLTLLRTFKKRRELKWQQTQLNTYIKHFKYANFFLFLFFIFLFCNTHFDHKGINCTSTHTQVLFHVSWWENVNFSSLDLKKKLHFFFPKTNYLTFFHEKSSTVHY